MPGRHPFPPFCRALIPEANAEQDEGNAGRRELNFRNAECPRSLHLREVPSGEYPAMVSCEFAAHPQMTQNLCVFERKISCRSLLHKQCLGNSTEPNATRGRAPTSGLFGENEGTEKGPEV